MGRDSSRRNQSLYCHYHRDRGHTTEDCRTLRDNLNQLTRPRKLNQFLHQPTGQFVHSGSKFHKGSSPWTTLGTINVSLARPRNNGTSGTEVMFVGGGCDMEANDQALKRTGLMVTPTLGFSEEDKQGTFQPHDDALVVTIRIGGYDMKRVLVD